MTISYIPTKDELVLRFRPLEGKPSKEFGRFKLWWNDEGCIDGIDIMPYMEELEEFKRIRNTVRLGGLWKGVEITEEDIKGIRDDLLSKLEDEH
jgi:hypothetical protein